VTSDGEHTDAWSADFVDLASLNAEASDAILARIAEVRRAAGGGEGAALPRSCTLILGPAGAGKTHLFARLRRRCGHEASFALTRPELGGDPLPRHVLAAALDALQRPAAGSALRQADLIVAGAVARLDASHRWLPPPSGGAEIARQALGALRQAGGEERRRALASALDSLEGRHGGLELAWLARFLAQPFAEDPVRRAALRWLSGREPDSDQLATLGVRRPLSDESVLPALRSLAALAAYAAPLVLVFDQVENIAEADGSTGRIHGHARLVCELFDCVPGVTIVQLALDAEWHRRIGPALAASERSRLESRVIPLRLPRPEERRELVRAWLASLPLAAGERRAFPGPLAEEDLRAWEEMPGLTPRALMIACREALVRTGVAIGAGRTTPDRATATATALPTSFDELLARLWDRQLDRASCEIDDAAADDRGVDRSRLRGGVAAALRFVEDLTVSGAGAGAPHDLDLRKADTPVTRVFVLQHLNARSAYATLGQAFGAAAAGRVTVLRERAIAFPPTWKRAGEHLAALRSRAPRAFVELERDEVANLLALHDLLSAAQSQDLTDDRGMPVVASEVERWARRSIAPQAWPVVRATLGRSARRTSGPGPASREHAVRETHPVREADEPAAVEPPRGLRIAFGPAIGESSMQRSTVTSSAQTKAPFAPSAARTVVAWMRSLGRTIRGLNERER
jgi:hypothetical protein